MNSLEDLTVFIISSEEETYASCLEALETQDCTFHIRHIRGVSPMSAAFQSMPESCTTNYFLQVDADMVLYTGAVKTLYESVRNSSFRTYMVSGQLFEEGFGPGGAVKCWKRSFFRFFKFRDVRTVDRDLYRRLRRFGLTRIHLDDVVGVHRPRHSAFSSFLKTKSDVEKWRFLKRPPEMYATRFLEDALKSFPASRRQLLGMLLGALTGADTLIKSKNMSLERQRYRDTFRTLGLDEAMSGMDGMTSEQAIGLKQAFLECYEDYRSTDKAKRERLASLIMEGFSQRPIDSVEAKDFLETMGP